MRQDNIGSIAICIFVSKNHDVKVNSDCICQNVPFVLGLSLLSNLKALLDVGRGSLALPVASWKIFLAIISRHLYTDWSATKLFTVWKLCWTYRHFFHAKPKKNLQAFLKGSCGSDKQHGIRKLDKIGKECDTRQGTADVSRRFWVSLPDREFIFNKFVYMDHMSIARK